RTDAITTALTGSGAEITGLLHRIHELAETAYVAVESFAAIAAVLESRCIAVETGLYGVETTLQATTGNGNGRTIAILAEYDALPEIGHACGHNLIAAAGVGAFLALDELYRQNPEAVPG
ncbi:amidohydrolase, partial [Burkholderia multivorans]